MTIHFRSQHIPAFDGKGFEQQAARTRARKPITIEGQVQKVTRSQRPVAAPQAYDKPSKAAYNASADQTKSHSAQLLADNGLQPARSGVGLFNRVANYTHEVQETRGALIDTFA